MSDDLRCCGTGTCIINDEGVCWCGQKWDGEKMCFPAPSEARKDKLLGQQIPLSSASLTPLTPQDD